MRAEPLLAPCPLHDSELVSEARGLHKISFVHLESNVFCFPFKAWEPHDDSEHIQECISTLIFNARCHNVFQCLVLPCRWAKEQNLV